MELRVLRYFLAIAREENITAAAEYLHVSQPTLSRQIQDLEAELGKQLLIRGSRHISLTPEGQILRKRAEEIITLADRTEKEIMDDNNTDIEGDIYIGAGESAGIHLLTKPFSQLQKEHPHIRLNILSGDTMDVFYQLDNGLVDFGLLFSIQDSAKYNSILFDYEQKWCVIMRKDHPLAKRASLTWKDLENQALIVSRSQSFDNSPDILQDKMRIAATYTLAYNASIMVRDGIGIAPVFSDLINTEGTDLCSVPLTASPSPMFLVWKKYQTLSRQAELFLHKVQEE